MDIVYERRLRPSIAANRSASVSIPRAVAQAWEDAGFDAVDMIFDGANLVIKPKMRQ